MNDIRMANLQIAALKSAAIYIPYTDRLKDGKTAFNYVRFSKVAPYISYSRLSLFYHEDSQFHP